MAPVNSITETYRISVTLWIPMNFTSLFGIILIQLTAFFGRLVKGRVWYGFMTSLAILCFSSCLLYISGQQPTNELDQEPNHFVCLTQAALVYSAQPLVLAMLLSLFLELYRKVSSTHPHNNKMLEGRTSSPLFLILPYGLWCLLVIGYILFGLIDPGKATLNGLNPYCAFDHPVPRIVNCIICAILAQAILNVIGMIAVRLVMINKQSAPQALPCLREYTILFIRFALIWIACVVALVISIIFAIQDNPPIIEHVIAQAGAPLLVVITFGTQKDVLIVWRDLVRGFFGKVNMIIRASRKAPIITPV